MLPVAYCIGVGNGDSSDAERPDFSNHGQARDSQWDGSIRVRPNGDRYPTNPLTNRAQAHALSLVHGFEVALSGASVNGPSFGIPFDLPGVNPNNPEGTQVTGFNAILAGGIGGALLPTGPIISRFLRVLPRRVQPFATGTSLVLSYGAFAYGSTITSINLGVELGVEVFARGDVYHRSAEVAEFNNISYYERTRHLGIYDPISRVQIRDLIRYNIADMFVAPSLRRLYTVYDHYFPNPLQPDPVIARPNFGLNQPINVSIIGEDNDSSSENYDNDSSSEDNNLDTARNTGFGENNPNDKGPFGPFRVNNVKKDKK
jgi:hypothetical protein